MRSGATSLFNVQRWMFDVRRSSLICLCLLLPATCLLAVEPVARPHPEGRPPVLAYAEELARRVRADAGTVPLYGYRILKILAHDPAAFTQGLVYADGYLYESTGNYGRSTLRKVRLETGEILKLLRLSDRYFGEGLTIWQERLIQLTWKSGLGFVYAKDSFTRLDTFSYPHQGWGITRDSASRDSATLIVSDGTETLRFLDPRTFHEIRQIKVHHRGRPVFYLNELEVVQGEIYANVWQTDLIARIAPADGRIAGWIDLAGLQEEIGVLHRTDVLNGIAYDAEKKRLWVTGKLWPVLVQIEVVPKAF